MEIVAEGVETEFEATMMTQFGCSELQGFYFSVPKPAAQIVELLKTYHPKRPGAAHMRMAAGESLAG
jgi:EAL domain-containing protein (putative c-di-GMP-specific phosphodiesterase class I)